MQARQVRRVAVSIPVVSRTASGNLFSLRRLRELPDLSEANSALGGAGRTGWEVASRSGRAGIVGDPISDVATGSVRANVFRSHNIAVIRSGDAGAVDTGAESGGRDRVDPGVDVSFLLGQHAPALLLIEEDDGLRRKAFAPRGSDGGLRVGVPKLGCVGNGFQFGVQTSVEEHEESEASGFDGGTMAGPGVRFLAGRIVEPVSRVRKSLPQDFQVRIAGISVAVEAEAKSGFLGEGYPDSGYRQHEICGLFHKHYVNLVSRGAMETRWDSFQKTENGI